MKLRAFIDESGTHGDSEHLTLGGVVSSSNKWKRFDRGWNKAVRERNGGEPIHAKQLIKMRDNAELVNELFEQAERYVHYGLTVTVDRAEFRDFYKIRDQPGHQSLDSEYGLLFGCWIETARNVALKLFPSEPVHGFFVVLEESQYAGSARGVYRQIEDAQAKDDPLLFVDFQVGSKTVPGLQLSDMMAHMAWRREHVDEPGFHDIAGDIAPELLTLDIGDDGNPFPIFRVKLDSDYLKQQRAAKLGGARKRNARTKSRRRTSGT